MIFVVAPVSPVSLAGSFPALAASWRWRVCPTAWRLRLPMSLWREIAGVDCVGAGTMVPVYAWYALVWKLLPVLLPLLLGARGQVSLNV